MASNYSRYSSVRVYRRYCFGAIFSGLLCLGVAAIFAVFLLFPLLTFKQEGSEAINVTGLQYAVFSFRSLIKNHENLPALLNFKNFNDVFAEGYLKAYPGLASGAKNPILGFIADVKIGPIIGYVLIIFLVISVIFALVSAILGLVFIFAGRLSNPKMGLSMTRTSLIFLLIFLGLLFFYLFFCQEIFKACAADGLPEAHFGTGMLFINTLPLLLAGGLFVLTIVLHITYSAAFKNKVFAGRKKKGEEGAQVEVNNPQYGQPMAYQQMNNQAPYGGNMMNEPAPMKPAGQMGPMTLPTDLREIGDHAYAKCLTLKVANIPQGVSDIGPSAFSNCLNLETVTIPISVKEIGYNCFFNTPNLKKIVYQGRVEDWKKVVKGSNWLTHSGVNIVTAVDGKIAVKTQ